MVVVRFFLGSNEFMYLGIIIMSQTIYCPSCGNPSPSGQKFCEKCGTRLPTAAPPQTTSQPSMAQGYSPQPPQPPSGGYGGLFDPRNMAYFVQEKYWSLGSGPIYDQNGTQIGKMSRKIFNIRSKIEFQEMNGQVVASIQQKLVSLRPTYTLLDPNENVIARLEKTLLSVIHPKFELKDPAGNLMMVAHGKFMGFDFEIEANGRLMAEVHKQDRWRDVFFGGVWNFKDTYGVKIHDPQVDRRLILGFVLAIDNVLHDQK